MSLIAVIDDDQDILEASSLILKARGFDVVAANNPDDGYKIIKEKNPDLIILDVIMNEPDDGFFLAQKLRREKITTPIIMYTSIAKATGLNFSSGNMIPVDEFVEKPISPDELISKVEKFLKQAPEK